MSDEIRRYIDEAKITKVLNLYARGCDRADLDILISAYHSDAVEEHGIFSGSAMGFCAFAVDFARSVQSLSHHISNILIDVNGDVAYSECYFLSASIGLRDDQPDETLDVLIAGRYLDRFEQRGTGWKIARRQVVYDWHTQTPHSGQWHRGFAKQWTLRGRSDRQDFLYTFLEGRQGGTAVQTETLPGTSSAFR